MLLRVADLSDRPNLAFSMAIEASWWPFRSLLSAYCFSCKVFPFSQAVFFSFSNCASFVAISASSFETTASLAATSSMIFSCALNSSCVALNLEIEACSASVHQTATPEDGWAIVRFPQLSLPQARGKSQSCHSACFSGCR
jgi:hypothetical protein